MTPIERVIAAARAEIGYLEKATNAQLDDKTANAGYNNWTKYAAFLDDLGIVYNGRKNGYSWCDVFVDWCFITTFGVTVGMDMTFQPDKGCGAGCTWSARYYKQNGKFHEDNPQPGDQIFFTNDGGATSYHTGLVVAVDANRVYTIEGNTSSKAGVVENGGCVRDKSYPLNASYIMGYGTPDWDLVATKEENNMETLTQDQFNEMFRVAMAKYRAELQDNDCGGYSAEGRQFVIDKGIMVGGSPLPDGSPNYMWQDLITREQHAVTLLRFARAFGLA